MTLLNSFNGGMGNDEYLLADGQYVYSENLDIYRDPRWIQLAVKPTQILTGLPSLPIQMLFISSTGLTFGENRNTILCLENKDIIDGNQDMRYEGSTLRPVSSDYRWTGAYLTVDSNLIFQDYEAGILVPRFVNTPASGGSSWTRETDGLVWTDYALDMQVFSLCGNGIQRPTIRIGSRDYITDNSDIIYIEQTSSSGGMPGGGVPFGPGYPTITAYPQGISQPGENIFLSAHSDSTWTVSRNLTAISSELSAVSLTTVANEGVKQLQINKNTRFIHGTNKSGTDILIAGDEESRGATSGGGVPLSAEYSSVYAYIIYGFGADAQQLIARSRKYGNIETAFSNHGLTYYLIGIFGNTEFNWAQTNEMVYTISNKDDVGLIYAYGKSVGGIKDGWSVIVSKNSQGKTMKRIGCLYRHATKNGFYFSYEDEDGVFGVDYYDDISLTEPTSYQASGKIYIRNDDGGDMSIKKEIKEVQAGLFVPEDTSIVLSYILDNNGTEVTYDTITHTTQGTEDYKKYRGNKPIKGYKTIAWFAELQTTGTSSPKIFNFNYEPVAIQN